MRIKEFKKMIEGYGEDEDIYVKILFYSEDAEHLQEIMIDIDNINEDGGIAVINIGLEADTEVILKSEMEVEI